MSRPAPGWLLARQLRDRGRATAGEASAVTKPAAARPRVMHLTRGVLAVARAVGRMWFDRPVTEPARLDRSCDRAGQNAVRSRMPSTIRTWIGPQKCSGPR